MIHPQEPQTSQSPRADPISAPPVSSKYVSRKEVPHVFTKLKPYLSRYRSTEAAFLDIDSVHTDKVLVSTITDSLGIDTLRVYSMFIGSEQPGSLFNLCIEEFNDTLSSPYVLMYLMDSTFVEGYFEGEKTMDEFVGTLTKHDLETVFGYNTRIPDPALLKRCLMLVFGPANTATFGAGAGGGSGNWNPPPPGTGVIVEYNGSTFGGGTSGGQPCWGIIVDPLNPRNWAILIDSDCDGVSDQIIKPRPQTLWDGSSEQTKNSRDEIDDCINLLIMCGIIDERPRVEDGGTQPPEKLPTFGQIIAEQLGFMPGTQLYDDVSICLGDSTARPVQMLIARLLDPGVLSDPCNPAAEAADLLQNAIAAGCGNGSGVTEEELYEELNNFPYIIMTDAFKTCGPLECIFNTLQNTSNELFCGSLDNFVNDPLSNLTLDVDPDYFEENPTVRIVTRAAGSGANLIMLFNPSLCDIDNGTDMIEIARDLLHEAIHTKMFYDCWPSGMEYSDYKAGFKACAELY